MNELFEKYHPEFLPRLNGSEQVEVKFNFELINIKEVVRPFALPFGYSLLANVVLTTERFLAGEI